MVSVPFLIALVFLAFAMLVWLVANICLYQDRILSEIGAVHTRIDIKAEEIVHAICEDLQHHETKRLKDVRRAIAQALEEGRPKKDPKTGRFVRGHAEL